MVSTIRQWVRVEAGGVVRVQSAELREGAVAEVLVLTEPSATAPVPPADPVVVDPSWEQFIGMAAHTGRTVEQIDADLRALRDEWDR